MDVRGRRGALRWVTALAIGLVLVVPACDRPFEPVPETSKPDLVTQAIAADFDTHVTDDQIRSIIVTVGDRTLFERYYATDAEATRSTFSVTKSFMSTLVGQAIGEGKLSLDDTLSELLPAYAKDMTPRVAGVTLGQLLTMTGGFPDTSDGLADTELARSPNWVRHILAHQDGEPGKEFVYSNFDAHLLSPILEQATGQTVLAYARTHLFDPLGIPSTPAAQPVLVGAGIDEFDRAAGFAWATDPQGIALGFTHLKIRPRDMARFGQLFLREGRWNGRQVVPSEWVRDATTAHTSDASTQYGYLWWLTEIDHAPAFYASGLGGQLIAVVPQRQLVVVISTYVDLATYRPLVQPDDIARLADAIVRAAGTTATK